MPRHGGGLETKAAPCAMSCIALFDCAPPFLLGNGGLFAAFFIPAHSPLRNLRNNGERKNRSVRIQP
jgi:hypothetical protein